MGPQIIQIQKRLTPYPHQSLSRILKQLSLANPNQDFVSELCNIFKYSAYIGFQAFIGSYQVLQRKIKMFTSLKELQ